ncbi:MAG: hypothetical protein QM372_06415 [Bacillota bacterium]|jgi:hypothetical protein|nr:hypothetical protein [Bacillota bacterium]
MKKELNYFTIDGGLGWNQHWFKDKLMYFGGCAAVTACDLCIYLAGEMGLIHLYPYDAKQLTKDNYAAFAKTMKRFLGPRIRGIDTLQLYTSGFSRYLANLGGKPLRLVEAAGTIPAAEARELIQAQIDAGLLVPYLLLLHRNRSLKDYHWHWFNLAGYEKRGERFLVKAVTYGSFRWLDLEELWDTGYERKGGLIRVLT